MASHFCNNHDPDTCSNNETPRRAEEDQDERAVIRASYSSNRIVLQLELDLRELDISLSKRCIHSDAQGKYQSLHVIFLALIYDIGNNSSCCAVSRLGNGRGET